MHERALRHAAALAAAILLLTTSMAAADTLPGDADDLTSGTQSTMAVGPIAVGGQLTASLWFQLTCRGLTHVDPGQSVGVAFRSATVPTGGMVTSTGTTIGPVPADWPVDGDGCPTTMVLRSAVPATVTLTAPAAPGVFDYVLDYARTLSPVGSADGTAISSLTGATFRLTVVADAAPTLTLPADMVVEGDTAGGAVVAWTASVSDAEDDPDPVPVCDPASGGFLPLGVTSVACSVTDSAGVSATGSFSVTVQDTTPPALVGLPAGVALVASDPAGSIAAYAVPSAVDTVDPAPTVTCSPAPGDAVPVGTTTVTCVTTDGSGNVASGSFLLDVEYLPPVVFDTSFEAPVGVTGMLVGTSGRTIPIKAHVVRDGHVVTTGSVELGLAGCSGGVGVGTPLALAWAGGRWVVELHTDGLFGCIRATVSVDGADAGSFELHLATSASSLKAKGARR